MEVKDTEYQKNSNMTASDGEVPVDISADGEGKLEVDAVPDESKIDAVPDESKKEAALDESKINGTPSESGMQSVLNNFDLVNAKLLQSLSKVKDNLEVFQNAPESKAFWIELVSQATLMQRISEKLRNHATLNEDPGQSKSEGTNGVQEGHEDADVVKEYGVETVAGGAQGFKDGKRENAMFNYPCSVFSHGDDLYVADKDNCSIRKIESNKNVSTLLSFKNLSLKSFLPCGSKDVVTEEMLSSICPRGVGMDSSGSLFIADLANHRIWKFEHGFLESFAGSSAGYADGSSSEAKFNCPCSLAVDPRTGYVYVADLKNNCIRKITAEGEVSTLAGAPTPGYQNGTGSEARFNFPCGVAIDSNANIYVADSDNNAIRKITPQGFVSTAAGGKQGGKDGVREDAEFNGPCGLDVDLRGNIYVADAENFKIRRISRSGVVSTVASGGGGRGNSFFDCPCDVAVDKKGNIYVADWWNHRIRKLIPGGNTNNDTKKILKLPYGGKENVKYEDNVMEVGSNPVAEWVLSNEKINLPGTVCFALCLESISIPLDEYDDAHIVVTVTDSKGLICGKSIRTKSLSAPKPVVARRRSSLFKIPSSLRRLSNTSQTKLVFSDLGNMLYLCPPQKGIVDDKDYVIFLELKHWKDQSKKNSLRCFTFIEFKASMLTNNVRYALPLYKKPTDFTRNSLHPLREQALNVDWLPYHSQQQRS